MIFENGAQIDAQFMKRDYLQPPLNYTQVEKNKVVRVLNERQEILNKGICRKF